jgi:hypothetical protein
VVVRAATARFLAELAVAARLLVEDRRRGPVGHVVVLVTQLTQTPEIPVRARVRARVTVITKGCVSCVTARSLCDRCVFLMAACRSELHGV